MQPIQPGDILAGKYRVDRVIGEGGMGVVVAAWHIELDQRVAVKFLLPEIAERGDAAERFRREARAAVKIKSEHVARVLDVGTLDDGVPYMVMEYLDGHDLAAELRERRRLDVTETADIVIQACEAVAEAHASGIVHRDLKPANLYLARRADGSRAVKVLDFGISKSIVGGSLGDLSLTRTSSMIGSPLYMSPEQMRSARDVDPRADIWSLGVILYECLTGRPPYNGENVPQLCSALLNDTPAPFSDVRRDVPDAMEQCVLKCLEKERTHRWPTVAELARALAPFASQESRVHVERAARVQGVTDVTMNVTMASAPAPEPVAAPGPDAAPTVDSWGRTGDAPAEHARAGVGRWVALGAAAAAIAVGAAVLLASGRAGTAPASAASASPLSVPVQAAIEPPVEPPATSVAPPAPSAVEAPPGPPASATPAPAVRLHAAAPAPKPRAAPRSAAPQGGSLPDFGGRE